MRTIEEAIAEETCRYVGACIAVMELRHAGAKSEVVEFAMHIAHIRRLAVQRLRHRVVTQHEAVRAATPSVHAYADLDGYSMPMR